MTEEIVSIQITSINDWCNKYKTLKSIFVFVSVRGNGWSTTYKNEDYCWTQPTVPYTTVVCIFFYFYCIIFFMSPYQRIIAVVANGVLNKHIWDNPHPHNYILYVYIIIIIII